MVGAVAASEISKNKATPYIIGGVIILGIGVLYFGIIRPILCATGISTCRGSKKAQSIMGYKGFDPNFADPKKVTISHDRAKKIAEKIYKSGGLFDDDEGGFYSGLEEAGSPHNLSLISRMFGIKYGKSMSEYVTDYMDDTDEIERIKDIIESY